MDRSFASGAAGSPPSYPGSPSIGYPTAGNPSLAVPATKPGPWWYYMVNEELRKVVTDAGLTPDGSSVVQLKAALDLLYAPLATFGSAIQGAFKNLVASATGNSANISVSADEIAVENASNAYKTLRAVSLTIAGTSVGANALDAGTIAASTWYSVWVIWNGATTSGLLSLSATAPTMPGGYTHKARVGWIRTDASGNKYPLGFKQYGNQVRYIVAAATNVTALPSMASGALGNTSTPTWSAAATGNFIPSTASAIDVVLNIPASNVTGMVAPNNSYGASTSTTNPPPLVIGSGTAANGSAQARLQIESSNIYYASTSASGLLQCAGWTDNL